MRSWFLSTDRSTAAAAWRARAWARTAVRGGGIARASPASIAGSSRARGEQRRQRRRVVPVEVARVVGAEHAHVAVDARGQHRRAAAQRLGDHVGAAFDARWRAPAHARAGCGGAWPRGRARRASGSAAARASAPVPVAQRRIERRADVVRARCRAVRASRRAASKYVCGDFRRAGGPPSARADGARSCAAAGAPGTTGSTPRCGCAARPAAAGRRAPAAPPARSAMRAARPARRRRSRCRGTGRCRSAPAPAGRAAARARPRSTAPSGARAARSAASAASPRQRIEQRDAVSLAPAAATSATRSASCRCSTPGGPA